jgi:hypothetical protein
MRIIGIAAIVAATMAVGGPVVAEPTPAAAYVVIPEPSATPVPQQGTPISALPVASALSDRDILIIVQAKHGVTETRRVTLGRLRQYLSKRVK